MIVEYVEKMIGISKITASKIFTSAILITSYVNVVAKFISGLIGILMLLKMI